MSRPEEQVRVLAVGEAEEVVAVLGPAVGGLVGFLRQQRWEGEFLAPIASISSRTIASTLRITLSPSGSQV